MNKFAITFRRTCKLFSKVIPSGLGEILEMHSAVLNGYFIFPLKTTHHPPQRYLYWVYSPKS